MLCHVARSSSVLCGSARWGFAVVLMLTDQNEILKRQNIDDPTKP